MKNIFAFLLAGMMMLAVVGCSSDGKEYEPSSPTSDTTQNSIEEPREEVKPDKDSTDTEKEPEQEKPSDMQVQTITGKIVESSTDSVTIETEYVSALKFTITEDTDQTHVNGLTVGDQLEITYTGTIENDDASNAVVVKLVQSPPAAE